MSSERFPSKEPDNNAQKVEQAKIQFRALSSEDRKKMIVAYHSYLEAKTMPEETLAQIAEFLPWAEGYDKLAEIGETPPNEKDNN